MLVCRGRLYSGRLYSALQRSALRYTHTSAYHTLYCQSLYCQSPVRLALGLATARPFRLLLDPLDAKGGHEARAQPGPHAGAAPRLDRPPPPHPARACRRLQQIERKVKTVARALAQATTSRPNLKKVSPSAGSEHQTPSVSSEARSKDGNLLKGPWAGPKPHAAASLRPPGSHLIRLAGRHLELLSGRPGRDEDPAASG